MAERETSRFIDETAADWIARLDRGPLSDEETQALEAWLEGDPRRRGALLRANAVSMASESARALGPQFDPDKFTPPEPTPRRGISRRKALTWVGAGGAVVASIVALGISLPAGAITTGLGEVRLVTLDDGSTVMLNTQTSVRVRYSDAERRVELLDGEAFFTILRDPRRAFLVDAGDTRLRVTEGAFRVRKLAERPLDILVDRGGVSLGLKGTPEPLLLAANSRLVLPSAISRTALPAPQPVTPDLLTRELAWREGKIAFEGERLDAAAAEFVRYSNMRIEIRDPSLAGEPVTGFFSASDPVGFAHAVAGVFDARSEVRGNTVVLSRAPRDL